MRNGNGSEGERLRVDIRGETNGVGDGGGGVG